MNHEHFKNLLALLSITGGKYILVEDGVPKAVLMSYDEFQDLAAPKVASDLASRIEDINREITRAQALEDLREEVIAEPEDLLAPSEGGVAEQITVEPLELV